MKVGLVATNLGTIQKPWLLDAKGLMAHSGNNLGNLAFWYAADLLIDAEKHCMPWSAKRSSLPADIKALVIPAANFINATVKLHDLARTVREFDLPCILIGIGAQAERENLPPKVDQSVIDFLNEVSARTPFIGLRGDYTKQMTDGFGISNTRVLGCPSILINPDPNLGQKIEAKIKAGLPDGPYVFHASCVKESLRSVEREFINLINSYPGSRYVVQRPVELIMAARREPMNKLELEYLEKCVKFFGFFGRGSRFEDFLRQQSFFPASIDGWINFLMQMRAGINTRIHGTLMGIAAGIPSLCVVHDSRTRELAKQLMVPALEIGDFIATRHRVDDMFARAAFDGARFDANRQKIAAQYCELLETVGLKPSKHLSQLANQAEAIDPVRPRSST
jgi:hypothetical protein